MPRNPLREDVLELAWSLWAEMGVSGWARHHSHSFVDPEPLVLLTAWLGDSDARLRDEATDWCISYGSWLSATRMTNLLALGTPATHERFGEFAATVAAHSSLHWRGATTARRYKPTKRSRLESFRAPSLIGLRLRAILGVGARAEVVRAFLASPTPSRSASDLVDDTAFKKRNVSDALESLHWGGVLESERLRNQNHYRLADPESIRRIAGVQPERWPRWSRALPALAILVEAEERFVSLPSRARNVEVVRLLRDQASLLRSAQLPTAPEITSEKSPADAFSSWLAGFVHHLAHEETGRVGKKAVGERQRQTRAR